MAHDVFHCMCCAVLLCAQVMNNQERLEAARACKWADEVVFDTPYDPSIELLDRLGCDFGIHGDDIPTNTDGTQAYGDLRAAGFSVERRLAYASVARQTLPEALREPLDIVLFHSARAAESFITLGAPNAAQLTAACLSASVAAAVEKTSWKRIITASHPREDDLLTATLGG